MWVRLVAFVALAGCGRLGFDDVIGRLGAAQSRLKLARLGDGVSLRDFPLLVVLDDTRAARELMRPDASDLRFFDSSGQVLPHEIEQVGAAGGAPLLAWVRIPALSPTTSIYAAYGSEPTATSVDSAWSDEFEAVWHLAGDTRDSTANHHDGVPTGTAAAPGAIGTGRAFDASRRDVIAVASGSGVQFPALTISGWLFENHDPPDFYSIVSRENGSGGDDDLWIGSNFGSASAEFTTTPGGDRGVSGTGIQAGRWTHVAGTADGMTIRLFVDGNASTTHPLAGTLGADRNGTSTGGGPDTDFVDGVLDEVRIERVARPPEWIAADVASQLDQLVDYGAIDR
jgi:hypothetical protein